MLIEKKCMLYILKLIYLQWKNGYVIHNKVNMFTTETRKKTDMLYILKLVRLLLKYKKPPCVAHIQTSMFTTEIREKQVCCTY